MRSNKRSGRARTKAWTISSTTAIAVRKADSTGCRNTSTHGLESDYASLHKEGKDDRDRFQLHLGQLLFNSLGEAAATHVTTQFHQVNGDELCRVQALPCGFPVGATIVVDKKGNLERKQAFFVRLNNGTREMIDPLERQKYILTRWGPGQPTLPGA